MRDSLVAWEDSRDDNGNKCGDQASISVQDDMVNDARDFVRALKPEPTDTDHPRHEVLVGYVDAHLDAADREWVEAHLEVCRICTEDVADLREMERLLPAAAGTSSSPDPRRRVQFAVVASIAAAILLTTWVVFRNTDGVATPPQQDATTAGNPPVSTPVPPLPAGPSEPRRLRVQLPVYHDALRPKAGVLLRENTAASRFVAERPVGTAVETTRPVFRWTPLEGATSYRVTVVDETFTEVASASGVTGTTWTPERDLPRDTVLTWQVRAEMPDGTSVVTPAPPMPEARVFVLSERNVQLVAMEREAKAGAPGELGMLLARLGLYDEAVVQFTRALDEGVYPRADIERAIALMRR